jgi:hypothetical protein
VLQLQTADKKQTTKSPSSPRSTKKTKNLIALLGETLCVPWW